MAYILPRRSQDNESAGPRIVGRFVIEDTADFGMEYRASSSGVLCYLMQKDEEKGNFLAVPKAQVKAADLNPQPFDVIQVDITERDLKSKTPKELRQMVSGIIRAPAAVEFAYSGDRKAQIRLYERRS